MPLPFTAGAEMSSGRGGWKALWTSVYFIPSTWGAHATKAATLV